jgi:hypothetical protein
MAMIFGPEGPGQFTIGRSLPVPYTAPVGAAQSAELVDPWVKKLAERLKGLFGGAASSVAGGALKRVPGAGLAVEGAVGLATEGPNVADVIRTGVGTAALGVPLARPLALGMTGGELASSGIAALAESRAPSVLSPSFQKQVESAGGTQKFVQGVQDRTIAALEAQDAAAQKVADARTARVNEVINASRAERAALTPAETAARSEVANAPQVNMNLGTNWATLGDFYGQVANRVQYNNALRAARTSELNQQKLGVEAAKVIAANKPDIKLATVKQGLNEVPVVLQNGQPMLSLTADDKGRVMPQNVLSPINREQLLANARDAFKKAGTRAEEKKIQEELKARGINEKLTK